MEEKTMEEMKVKCSMCGMVLHGESEEEMVKKYIDHAKSAHNQDVSMDMARKEVKSQNPGK